MLFKPGSAAIYARSDVGQAIDRRVRQVSLQGVELSTVSDEHRIYLRYTPSRTVHLTASAREHPVHEVVQQRVDDPLP